MASPMELAWYEFVSACKVFGMDEDEIASVRSAFFAGGLSAAYACERFGTKTVTEELEKQAAIATAELISYSPTRQ